jgi:hypothetical protein
MSSSSAAFATVGRVRHWLSTGSMAPRVFVNQNFQVVGAF